ncbi:class I SAM-dependent methyltransferase [Halogeometricum sp. S1BR25-6]|uniref:Class I SAM-dependent methyltransferase n=1 Tax=Halogeometricum salsisoli TaxID=2950536 RepID=A0ABU2GF22_9EURY|nr:class I SAM-dependent methyltransferase [Halogeometricum sp. S1BR25-6]MDS0298703.1 class I SAM-dependent methyltransferase [Halogeometricum sp. S1BR25-6]
MDELLGRYLDGLAPEHDDVQAEMADYADREGFPHVGPAAGGTLRVLARLTDADRVFEFGSGFGYSATWWARGMNAGEIILTEHDRDELDMAYDWLSEGGYAPEFDYQVGDALELVGEYEGPFDCVLIDHEKERYVDGFHEVADKVAVGGVVVADNVVQGPADFETLVEYAEGEGVPDDASAATRGIAAYLDAVRAAPDFETTVLPVGSGLTVSVRTGE